jgi:hypothetical protein
MILPLLDYGRLIFTRRNLGYSPASHRATSPFFFSIIISWSYVLARAWERFQSLRLERSCLRHPLQLISLFGWLVADGWCWFVLREEYCWLVAGDWFVVREKYWWLISQANRAWPPAPGSITSYAPQQLLLEHHSWANAQRQGRRRSRSSEATATAGRRLAGVGAGEWRSRARLRRWGIY